MLLTALLADLLDLVLPTSCAGCAEPAALLCPRCALLLAAEPRWCTPDPVPAGFPPTAAIGAYAGPLRGMLLAYKERGCTGLSPPLGRALAAAVLLAAPAPGGRALSVPSSTDDGGRRSGSGDTQPFGRLVLVPVPSRPAAVAERGGDHLLRLARQAARELTRTGRPATVLRLLAHTGRGVDSAGLSAEQRLVNTGRAFTVPDRGPLPPGTGTVLLVDDLATTGATLAAASTLLCRSGVPVHAAAVIAATARHARPPATRRPINGTGDAPRR